MRYILKYVIKSKYFGFKKEFYREFNTQFKIANFLINNDVCDWEVYEKFNCDFTDLLVNDSIEENKIMEEKNNE